MTKLQSVTFNKHIMANNRIFHDRCLQPKDGEEFVTSDVGVVLNMQTKDGLPIEILVPWENVTCAVAEEGDGFEV